MSGRTGCGRGSRAHQRRSPSGDGRRSRGSYSGTRNEGIGHRAQPQGLEAKERLDELTFRAGPDGEASPASRSRVQQELEVFEWHWNQKGTNAELGITNHTSVGQTEQVLGSVAKVYRVAGRVLLVVGAATDLYSIVTSSQPLRRSVQVVSGWTAAAGGCKVVGAGGAYVGTVVAPGVGTAVGGFIGCTVGAFIGYVSAERAAGYLFDWAATAVFGKITGQSVLPAPLYGGEGGSFGGGGTFGGGGASGTW